MFGSSEKDFLDKSILYPIGRGYGHVVYPLRQLEIDCAVPAVSGFERLFNYIRFCVGALKI